LRGARGPARPGAERLFPAEADPFFRAERLRPDPAVSLEAAFSILVVTEGSGRLETRGGSLELGRGDTVLVPFAAGPGAVRGRRGAVRGRPPDGTEMTPGAPRTPWTVVPTGAELAPERLLEAAVAATAAALEQAPEGPVAGVGGTSMAESGVGRDRGGRA